MLNSSAACHAWKASHATPHTKLVSPSYACISRNASRLLSCSCAEASVVHSAVPLLPAVQRCSSTRAAAGSEGGWVRPEQQWPGIDIGVGNGAAARMLSYSGLGCPAGCSQNRASHRCLLPAWQAGGLPRPVETAELC